MLQMLESENKVLLESGFVYLPLLFDPSIEKEAGAAARKPPAQRKTGAGRSRDLIGIEGDYFVKSISIASLLENFGRFDPETYDYIRRAVFNRFLRTLDPGALTVDEKLRTIVFQVMPHFVRKRDKLRKRTANGEDILDLIGRNAGIPLRYYEEANRFTDTTSLQKKLQELGGSSAPNDPPSGGPIPARVFRQWILKALEAKVIEEEKNRLGAFLYNRKQFAKLQKKYIAALLYIRDLGALDISGCGFFRNGTTSEYFVYVHTGTYALKDFYSRIYLFPDCRVAVSTSGPLVPYVLERYKHPFLKGYDRGQKICVRGDFAPAGRFSAAGAIQALEEGLGALFHGYNSRRGNGYHRLDGMKIEENSIVFEEYRISSDDPRLVSGEVEVKNAFY